MQNNQLEVISLAATGASLLHEAKQLIATSPTDEVKALLSRLPESIEGKNGPLKVVFAGQYSAGKSSVISALTGRDDIAIGAAITTQYTQAYHWCGVDIIDTPGVHTKIRPDHDEITYRALANADLLVFVITNELFDDYLGPHFRKLAIERDKAHEMLLLINKMRRHAKGNSAEAKHIITEDVRKVLVPFTPEDLHISFVDAESALSAQGKEQAKADLLLRKSGITDFANNLNQFIRAKGLTARYTTELYTMEQVLQECLAKTSSGDLDVDGLEELLLQKRRVLVEEQQRIPESVRLAVRDQSERIRADGRKISSMIHEEINPDDVNDELQRAQKRAEDISDAIGVKVQDVIGEHMASLEQRFEKIMDSELAKVLLPRLQKRVEDHLASTKISPELSKNLKMGADLSHKLGKFLVDKSFSPASPSFKALFELKNYSGTDTHKVVLTVGKYFGKKFKPWEAIKWTKHIANAGRFLAVAGVLISFYFTWREDVQEADQVKKLSETRDAIRSGFSDAAYAVETFFDEATQAYVTEVFTPEIEEVDRQLAELRDMQTQRTGQYNGLLTLLESTQALIRKIHQVQPSA